MTDAGQPFFLPVSGTPRQVGVFGLPRLHHGSAQYCSSSGIGPTKILKTKYKKSIMLKF